MYLRVRLHVYVIYNNTPKVSYGKAGVAFNPANKTFVTLGVDLRFSLSYTDTIRMRNHPAQLVAPSCQRSVKPPC